LIGPHRRQPGHQSVVNSGESVTAASHACGHKRAESLKALQAVLVGLNYRFGP
jgi:hypothetical protein